MASPVEKLKTKIEVANLTLTYGTSPVLHSINASFAENEIVAIIGPSGSGKSSFLRTLNRMNDLVTGAKISGHVYLDGTDIYAPTLDVVTLRRRVGMVFQRPNPFPMSIFQNVAYGLKVHGLRDERKLREIVEHSLRQAALWDEVKDKLNESALALSGGQQQRLCIARALAVAPEVLLMDEPASALDPIATAKIEELMDRLKASYSIIIVTHNMQQAGRVSDRTAFFLAGKLIEIGETRTVFTTPERRETEDYITGRFG